MRGLLRICGVALIASPLLGQSNACDLNQDDAVNVADVQLATNMAIGKTPCTAKVFGLNVCNVVVIQRVTNAALGGACVTGTEAATPHSATLSWVASASPNVIGYNVYRGSTAGGPYTKLTATLVSSLNYTDFDVLAGSTYYYVATAVDASNSESSFSNEAVAVIPTP